MTTMTGDNMTTSTDISVLNETVILQQMNQDERQRLIPTIVFLLIISVLGIFGNAVVCHVYRTKYRLSNSQCFILCLSAIDLFTCSIAIPFEVTTVLDQYTFTELWLCKAARFFNTLGTMSSSFLLLVIAIDRYRKVCRPFGWQISSYAAKILCGVSVAFGLVLAVPTMFVYGKQTFYIEGLSINGTECSTNDDMVDTLVPLVNAGIFMILFLGGIFTICILYCLIGAEVKRHANTMPGQYSTMHQASVPAVSSIDEARNSRVSGEFGANDIKNKRESKRKGKFRLSKSRKSESDLSWTGNKEDLSYSMDCTVNNSMHKEHIKLDTIEKGNNKTDVHTTDSDDSGIKSDQVIHEHAELDTRVDSDKVKITESVIEETLTDRGEEKHEMDFFKNEERSVQSKEHSAEFEKSQSSSNDLNINKDPIEATKTPSLGNSPSTSNEEMVTNKYAKNERSRSRLSSISSRISNAIRRMTSISSVTSSVHERKTQYLKQARARKTAFLMFMISLVFVLSYLPHLLLLLIRELKQGFVDEMTDTNKAVYKFFLRSYFLNSAINPIIYGVCDTRFRTACKEMFTCCKSKQPEIE